MTDDLIDRGAQGLGKPMIVEGTWIPAQLDGFLVGNDVQCFSGYAWLDRSENRIQDGSGDFAGPAHASDLIRILHTRQSTGALGPTRISIGWPDNMPWD